MTFDRLLKNIRACDVCKAHLPHGVRPVVQAHPGARLVIIGQAPGLKVHQSGIAWHDASGDRLREWLGLSKEIFYDPKLVANIPMGFCYPGKGKSGDLPPRKECQPLWHEALFARLPARRLTLLVGSHAQAAYLKKRRKVSLTETVRDWREYLPEYLPLPHPSPLNNIWLHKHRWFQNEVLPHLRAIIETAIAPAQGCVERERTAGLPNQSSNGRSSLSTTTFGTD